MVVRFGVRFARTTARNVARADGHGAKGNGKTLNIDGLRSLIDPSGP
jgi:hypothetical protein